MQIEGKQPYQFQIIRSKGKFSSGTIEDSSHCNSTGRLTNRYPFQVLYPAVGRLKQDWKLFLFLQVEESRSTVDSIWWEWTDTQKEWLCLYKSDSLVWTSMICIYTLHAARFNRDVIVSPWTFRKWPLHFIHFLFDSHFIQVQTWKNYYFWESYQYRIRLSACCYCAME